MHRLAILVVLAACGHTAGHPDDQVGNTCVRDTDCADRCLTDTRDFPGGFCTLACTSDNDCPSDSLCVTRAGGVCLFTCAAVNCTRLGAGWVCGHETDVGGGEVSVCKGD
jgi:hypothetical protein